MPNSANSQEQDVEFDLGILLRLLLARVDKLEELEDFDLEYHALNTLIAFYSTWLLEEDADVESDEQGSTAPVQPKAYREH